MQNKYIKLLSNPASVDISDIPILEYSEFWNFIIDTFNNPFIHCFNYFVVPFQHKYKFIMCIADDENKCILVLSHEQEQKANLALQSLTSVHYQFNVFEREIHENYNIDFIGHPWLKPIRYPEYRADKSKVISNYPFYKIDSDELHEVGVGPIHAGVIEPGYFRFLCNGENVLHLEIQLGFQHRGIEKLFIEKNNIIQQCILSESIAGDTAIGHALGYNLLAEELANIYITNELNIERTIALELERIAVHIGDTAAICGDVAYQLGQVVCEALRTIVINTTQLWCGNRLGKGMVRLGATHYPLSTDLISIIRNNLNDVRKRYNQIADRIFTLPSILARFEKIGIITTEQAKSIGAVGMAARSAGLNRDTRYSHKFLAYKFYEYKPITLNKGDVYCRALLRVKEINSSMDTIYDLLDKYLINAINTNTMHYNKHPYLTANFKPNSFAISVIEGWRGEICHNAITDNEGKIIYYKIKDPSFHNWLALALAVRNQEISDFPLCNKSFNLSYCGNDL